MQRDLAWVLDIVLACRDIQEFTRGLTETAFRDSELVRSAVVRKIEVIGEATRRLSTDFRAAHPEVPWQSMAGMRDRLLHGYDKIDWTLVWEVLQRRVPELLSRLEPLVPPEP